MSRNAHQWSIGLSRVPHLNGAAVRGGRKHDAIAGGPPNVPDSVAISLVHMLAAARGKAAIRRGRSQIPHADGPILAAGQQPRGEVRVEREPVNLTVVSLEAT